MDGADPANGTKITGTPAVAVRRSGAADRTAASAMAAHLYIKTETFAQVDNALTRKHGGLGLGLVISRKLIELHGGRILALSEGAGSGATFKIGLPAAPDARAAQLCPASTQVDAPLPRMEDAVGGLRVLLVEDDPDSLEAFNPILAGLGVEVVPTSSAQEGRAALRSGKFDGIFSDICMPEEDGYQFIRSLRADGVTLPAIALTALARGDDVRQAIAAGFSDHLSKPLL